MTDRLSSPYSRHPSLAVLFLCVALAMPGAGLAHEAPSGWNYDYACCSDKDCAPLHAKVTATTVGWLISSTGETIPYGDRHLRDSQDDNFHRCAMKKNGVATDGTRCLYVPPMGM